MKPNLNRMIIFARVVEHQSFSEAARRLGLSKSAVSKQIASLESFLGVRLLHRTTRRVQITEIGQVYYESCSRVIAEAQQIEHKLSTLQKEPLGQLRVHAPVYLGSVWLSKAVITFMKRYPELSVDLVLQDEYINLLEEEIDLAIRVGWFDDSSLVIRKLSQIRRKVCASPAYLHHAGTPQVPVDLSAHEWLIYTHFPSVKESLRFSYQGGLYQTIHVSGRLRSNNAQTIREALLAGMGMTLAPEFLVNDLICDGRLCEVLTAYQTSDMTLCAVYPHSRNVAAKVRLFVDFLQHEFLALGFLNPGKKE